MLAKLFLSSILTVLVHKTNSNPLDTSTEVHNTYATNATENVPDSVTMRNPVCPPTYYADCSHRAMIHGIPYVCQPAAHSSMHRDDYVYSNGIGAHKLHTRAVTWNEARKLCNEEGAHLAIINSFAEAQILLDMFNRSGPIKGATYQDVAYLGIHDLYKEGEWVTILGDSLHKTGYTKWSDKWGGQPDNGSGNQNCGVLMKEGGLDDVFCDIPFAFFCEISEKKIMKY